MYLQILVIEVQMQYQCQSGIVIIFLATWSSKILYESLFSQFAKHNYQTVQHTTERRFMLTQANQV